MRLRPIDPIADQLRDLGASRAAAERLSRNGTLLELPADSTLCRRGERGTQAFLLLTGEVAVHTDAGVIAVGAGEVIGEMATLDPNRTRNATVTATTDLTVLVFDVVVFRSLAREEQLRERLVPERAAA